LLVVVGQAVTQDQVVEVRAVIEPLLVQVAEGLLLNLLCLWLLELLTQLPLVGVAQVDQGFKLRVQKETTLYFLLLLLLVAVLAQEEVI
jgi:hypothetical protein